jgi:hypothetical protein
MGTTDETKYGDCFDEDILSYLDGTKEQHANQLGDNPGYSTNLLNQFKAFLDDNWDSLPNHSPCIKSNARVALPQKAKAPFPSSTF